jgi:hypothetical protein
MITNVINNCYHKRSRLKKIFRLEKCITEPEHDPGLLKYSSAAEPTDPIGYCFIIEVQY